MNRWLNLAWLLNNLELNTLKTVEMFVDFRRPPTHHHDQHCNCKLQWSHSDYWAPPSPRTWSGTITLTPLWKTPSRGLDILRQLRKFNLPQKRLIQFYSAIIESVLCTSITVWFSSATKSDLRRLQSDCWANHWYNPPYSPRTVFIQSE